MYLSRSLFKRVQRQNRCLPGEGFRVLSGLFSLPVVVPLGDMVVIAIRNQIRAVVIAENTTQ